MIGYNPSHLNKNETLLEAFHRVEAYLKANPQYQVYQSSAQYQDDTQEYTLNTIIVPEGSKVSAGDVVLFSNSYYAVITAVYELTFSVETAVSFRGPQGPKGDKGDKGDRGTGGAGSNPNLLINPNFAINQRGQSEYNQAGYTVDRWTLDAGATLTPQNDGIKLIGACRQFYEDPNQLWGKTVTLSFKTASGITSKSGTLPAVAPSANITLVSTNTDDSGVSAIVRYVNNKIAVVITATTETKIYWAKLEIGSVATEFSPPSIAEELPKCQRYYENVYASDMWGAVSGASYVVANYIFKTPKRTAPTLAIKNPMTIRYSGKNYTQTEQGTSSSYRNINSAVITFGNFSGLTVGQYWWSNEKDLLVCAFDAEI